MAKYKGRSGGVNVQGDSVKTKGDIVGGNKPTKTYTGDSAVSPQLEKEFAKIKKNDQAQSR
jgi:hypothetical protein